jgi:hypothetical protein
LALVNLPPGRKAIRCSGINKAQENENRAVYRFKSRLVAKEHSQKPGIGYNETFAPVRDKAILKFFLVLPCIFSRLTLTQPFCMGT